MKTRVGLSLVTLGAAAATAASGQSVSYPTSARSDYIEYCAGCHGLEGSSAPAALPQLKDRVGYFMCSEDGRRYIASLPNVTRAPVVDRQALADLMNYVVFEIGGDSVPAATAPFSADEMDAYANSAVSYSSIVQERARIVDLIIDQCEGVPPSLREFDS